MVKDVYVNRDGYKVQIFSDVNSDLIEFCSQGGGFAKHMSRDRFFSEFTPYEIPKYSPRNATFEHFDEGVSIEAWSNGMSWNGWATPYFGFEQALEVIKHFPELRFDAEQDAFIWKDPCCDEEDVYRGETVETVSGPLKLYPIGTGSWTWEWADEEY